MRPALQRVLDKKTGLLVALVGALLAAYVAASMAWPRSVPRVALLPRPERETWYDGCNWHDDGYERSGLVWERVDGFQTTMDCGPGFVSPQDDEG